MAKNGAQGHHDHEMEDRKLRLHVARLLMEIAARDTEYRDLYLFRARSLLAEVLPREILVGIRHDQERLPRLRDEVGRAIETFDWSRVHTLATETESIEHRIRSRSDLLELGEAVYGPAEAPIGPESLAAAELSPLGPAAMRELQEKTVSALHELDTCDPSSSGLYRRRADEIASIRFEAVPEPGVDDSAASHKRAMEALRLGQWKELAAMAERLLVPPSSSTHHSCSCAPLDLKAPALDPPVPSEGRMQDYGLVSVSLEARPDLTSYMSCHCATFPAPSEYALDFLSRAALAAACACGPHCCPGDLPQALRENLDLLKHCVFLTCLGTRYLPLFSRETILLEPFPEDAPPGGGLVARLGLRERVGLAREDVDAALAEYGVDVVREIGLDPAKYVIAPIPFDVYMRVAESFGWGRMERWTHFEGYQFLRGWRFRGLVGGHARYGGAHDLCSLGRSDGRETVITRFAVVSRTRLQAPHRKSGNVAAAEVA